MKSRVVPPHSSGGVLRERPIPIHEEQGCSSSQLIQLKRVWNVSLSALNYRLHAVGAMSDWHYRNLCIEIAKRGYRTREPQGSARETSQVLAKVFSALRAEGVTRAEIADALALPWEEVDKLVFGLVLTSVEGGSRDKADSSRPLARLRLV